MLILSRRPGEVIRIGQDIEITLVQVNGQQASIGIKAPRNVHIERDDIVKKEPRRERK